MAPVSICIIILFIVCTLFSTWQFWRASNRSKSFLIITVLWMLLQGICSTTDFYRAEAVPPRFFLLLGPPALGILILFLSKKGRHFTDRLNLAKLTLLHTVRIPVEICLLYLYVASLVPVHMTFEGYNFDILSGISAPFIYYIVFKLKKGFPKLLLAWNIICLLLLVNIVTIAILSAQTPFQQLAFEQPNTGVTYFPFAWLPGIVVPLVLLSHLATIRRLIIEN